MARRRKADRDQPDLFSILDVVYSDLRHDALPEL